MTKPNELLPCQVSDADIRLASDAVRRDPIFKTTDDIHGRAISSAIYRMANSEVARCYLRLVAALNTASTIPTDAELALKQAILDLHEAAGRFSCISKLNAKGCSELTREAAHRAEAALAKVRP